MKTFITELQDTLAEAQNQCIGLFKPSYSKQDVELVMEVSNSTVTTLRIGNLLAMNVTMWSKDSIDYKLFPEGETLANMMNNPSELNDFVKNL